MEDYLDEMLHLTADIAEELLTIKDTGQPLDDTTTEKIARLAEIAVTYRLNAPIQTPHTDTDNTGKTSDLEAETHAGIPASHAAYLPDTTASDAVISKPADEEDLGQTMTQDSSLPDPSAEQAVEQLESTPPESGNQEAVAENAIEEEEADAYQPPVHIPGFTARELRNAFTLNDVFLYQRSLFHGSPTEFKTALEEIASLSSATELKDYLEKVHGVDVSQPEAEAFMETVCTFF